ncbi:MAG: N-acetylmuramoyl-L-alanine amidase [Candidatus Eisenbacteria bacterium]
MIRRLFSICSVIPLLVVTLVRVSQSEPALVIYSDGRPSEEITILEKSGEPYLSLSQAARLLQIETTVDPKTGRATLRGGGCSLGIGVGENFWVKDGASISPGEPALTDGDGIYISVSSADVVVAQTFGKSMRWDAQRRWLMVGLPAPNILDLEVRIFPERVSATIKTIGGLPYEILPTANNDLEILIRGGVFSKHLGFSADGGLVERIDAEQDRQGAKIRVKFGSENLLYGVFPQWNPDAIAIVIWKKLLTEIPEPAFETSNRLAWRECLSGDRAKIDLVVIDPGHGGDNHGSIGPSGYAEEESNLILAMKLKSKLETRGVDVILTRDDDTSVSLKTRTDVANSVGADLFISLHANGFTSEETRGFEVYFLSPASDEDARSVAAQENASAEPALVARSQSGKEVPVVFWNAAQNEFVVESSHLAELVSEEVSRIVSIPNRGVKQAEFTVLKNTYLPSILVETAFITNPQEERLLKDDAFQNEIVDAIVKAISRLREGHDS